MLVVKQKVGDQTFKAQNLIKFQQPFEAWWIFNSSVLIPKSQLFFFFLFILCCSMWMIIICNLQHSRFITQGWTFRSSKIQWVWGSLMNTKQRFKISSFQLPNMHWSTIYVIQNDEWQNRTMWFPWINHCWDEQVWLAKLLCEQGMGLVVEAWAWMRPKLHWQNLNVDGA